MSTASGKVALVEKTVMKTGLPQFKSGDTLKVHVRIREGDKERLQVFEGTVIALNNTGSRRSFTIRKISHGVGVERVFPIHSPVIAKLEKVEEGRVRRAKLYYVRGRLGKAARVKTDAEA